MDICEVGKDTTSAFKGDSLPAGKKGLGEEREDGKGTVGLKFTSPLGEQGFKAKEQEVRPRGMVSSKHNVFGLEDEMLIGDEAAEYSVQMTIQQGLSPSDNTAVLL